MNKIILPVLISLFLLTGCIEWAARGIMNAEYLATAAENFVREQHETRQWIRVECSDSLKREMDILKQTGDEAAIRELLGSHYPDLVSVELVKAFQSDEYTYRNICGEK